jgi:DNA-binding MarR family transcriptional regulator
VSRKRVYDEAVADARWLTNEEERAWRGYRRMRALLDLQIERDLARDSGLSAPDYDVLSTLTESPGRSWRANELATRLLWSTSRLAHHVRRMERRGLVSRDDCPDDGRGAVVSLSDTGWAALQAAAPPHVESVRNHLIELLTPTEVEALATISAKVIGHFAARVRLDGLGELGNTQPRRAVGNAASQQRRDRKGEHAGNQ